MEFNLVDIRIHIRCSNPYQLQTFIMLRGSSRYPQHCREVVCHFPDKDCLTCRSRNECQYHCVFRQELASDPEALKKHQKPPLPFAFSFIEITAGKLECRLTVAGTAISSLEMLLEGFAALIKSLDLDDDCTIEKITSIDYHGAESPIGTEHCPLKRKDNIIFLSCEEILNIAHYHGNQVAMQLVTPLKLVANGKILNSFSFKQFMSSIMRRVSSLGYYYAGYEFDVDYGNLSRQAEEIKELSGSFVFSTQNGVQFSGITGEGSFEGICEELLQFLLLGSFLNVGKGASYGFGGYRICFKSDSISEFM